MKIATFNVNGIRARLPNLLAWLEREKPDIACLQELKTSDETFPKLAINTAGYGAIWHGQKSWNHFPRSADLHLLGLLPEPLANQFLS